MINTDFKSYLDENHTDKFYIKRRELHNILISDKYENKKAVFNQVFIKV